MTIIAPGLLSPTVQSINFNDLTVVDDTPTAYAGFRVNRDGTTDERDGAGYYQVYSATDWILLALQTGTIGDDYEMKTVKSSGTSLSGGLVDDTWADINAAREGYITSAVTHKEYRGTMYIREKADTANQVSGLIILDVL